MTRSNQIVTVLSVKKSQEKTHSKRDGRRLWVYEVKIKDSDIKWFCVIEPPLGELHVSLMTLNDTEGLLSRPTKKISYGKSIH